MKRLLFSLLVVIMAGASFAFTACAHKTEYDNKEVVKIETSCYGGYVLIDSHPTRTFDFEAGTVTDELILDEIWMQSLQDEYIGDPSRFPEYESLEDYQNYLNGKYNNPQIISTFSEEDAAEFFKKIMSQGIYTWEDKYENHMVDDLREAYIKIIFSDGSVKKTDFYNKKPSNYKRIQKSFEKYLGVSIMWNGN